MVVKRMAAAGLFIAGTALVAVPIVAGLGWLAAALGGVVGTVAGMFAGVLWMSVPAWKVPDAEIPNSPQR
jgi:ABC-type uncharacterized transport system permease subunit